MYKLARCIVITVLIFTAAACGRKSHTTVGDELTEDTSVTSVVESREPAISAGNEAFLQGDFQGAIDYYEEALRQNRSVAFYNMGVSHYMMQDINAAERYFRQAVEEDPTFDEAVMNLVAVLAEQEKSLEAEQYVSRLVNKRKTARVYVDMANLSIKNGSAARAAYYYERALSIDRESPFVLSNYANFLISLGELDEGERILELLEEKDFAVRYNLAYINWLRGDVYEAFEQALTAYNMDEDSEEGNNKLAALFASMKRYTNEADTLRKLINWNPKREYRLRLVRSYLHSYDIARANDEVRQLLEDYPDDPEIIVAAYDVMIAGGRITDGGRYIRGEYVRLGDDMLLYQAVRHISLYERHADEARRLLAVNRDTPFVNLARTAYNIRIGNRGEAARFLSRVPESTYNDYYIYSSFLLFKNGRLREAQEIARLIDETKPEYFWYHFVLAWDLRQPERILELTGNYRDDYIINARVPIVRYRVTPVIEDMRFSFQFNGDNPADITALLMYPFFIEPDDMYPFLALGYRYLKESDQETARQQLEKSLEYGQGVQTNNRGVAHLLNFNYGEALRSFLEAEQELNLDPIVQYNIGLVSYLNGNFEEATRRFTQATQLNRYFVPAYVGLGLSLVRSGEVTQAGEYFEAALSNALAYQEADTYVYLPMVEQAKYLALLAQQRPDRMLEELRKEPSSSNFTKAMAILAAYMINPSPGLLDDLEQTGIFRSGEVAYLLGLSIAPAAELAQQPSNDRNTVMAAKYITARRNRTLNEEHMAPFMQDRAVLTDMANLATFLRQREPGLRYLQLLSQLDLRYAPQYKAALYYFLWQQDFVNAEASYTTLERLEGGDRDVQYYIALAFLLQYNQRRLNAQVEDYLLNYPGDYRGRLLNAFKEMENQNFPLFLSNIIMLLQEEPFLFNKMPLELDIERF